MSIETQNKLIGKLSSASIKGSGIAVKGEKGTGIEKIEKTDSVGLIDTYTIYFTDGTTSTYTIKNGEQGIQGEKGDVGEVSLEQITTTKTTDIAEALTITDCAGVKGKLDIKRDKSIQEGEPTPDTPIDIRNVGDNINLAQLSNNIWPDSGTGGFVIVANTYGFIAKVKPNTQYVISKKYKGNRFIVVTSETMPEGNTTYSRLVFGSNHDLTEYKLTTQENENYIFLGVYYGTNEEEIKQAIEEVKIEKGSIATSPSEYGCGSVGIKVENEDKTQSKTVIFPMAEGQVLHKGDYLAEDGIHQVRKTLVCTGTENWTNLIAWGDYYRVYITLSDAKIYQTSLSNGQLCSHFTYHDNGTFGINDNTKNGIFAQYLDTQRFYFVTTETGLANWKSYLAEQYANGTPVTIEYELAEEIVIPYTEEQEEAYYQLQHLLMYEGYTSIECIDEIKPDIQVTYLYNNEINTTYGKKIDSLEERIRQLEKTLISLTSEVSEL